MKECLQCKKEFETKRPQAKFCSQGCRVRFFRANGKAVKEDSKIDILIKEVAELRNRISLQPAAKLDNLSFESKKYENAISYQPAAPKFKIRRSFDNYRELRIDCATAEDWAELKAEIWAADNLTDKQKVLLTS